MDSKNEFIEHVCKKNLTVSSRNDFWVHAQIWIRLLKLKSKNFVENEEYRDMILYYSYNAYYNNSNKPKFTSNLVIKVYGDK